MPNLPLQTSIQVPAPTPPPAPPAPGAVGGTPGTLEFEQFQRLRDLENQIRHLEGMGIEGRMGEGVTWAGMQGPFGTGMPPHIPDELIGLVLGSLTLLLLMIVGFPIARAIARRIDRQSAAPTPVSGEVVSRLERIEHAVETMAVEIERISEGQRFTTRLLTEQSRGARAGVGDAQG